MVCAIAASSLLFINTASAQQAAPATTPTPQAGTTAPESKSKVSDQIQTVTVTAQKRSEDASKVPIAISVLNAEALADQHVSSVEDLTHTTPNISFTGGASGNGPGLSNIQMRGVSSLAGGATVGIYMDDVSMTTNNLYSLGSAEPKFFDIDRVEVLRGPQGTLYGASSMGGTIKYILNQPNLNNFDDSIYLEASHTAHGGNNGTVNGVINQPLIPGELALRVGAQFTHDSGYINQLDPSTLAVINSGTNTEDDKVLHLALKWQPSKQLTITPSLFYQEVKAGDSSNEYITEATYQPQPDVQLPAYSTTRTSLEKGTDKVLVPSISLTYDMGFADLTSVTSYFKRTFDRSQDGLVYNDAFVAGSISQVPGLTAAQTSALQNAVGNLPSSALLNNEIHQFSEEIRLASKPYDPKGSNPVTWVGGLYMSNLHTTVDENDPMPGINALFAKYGVSLTNPATSPLAGAFPGDFPNDDSYYSDRHYLTKQEAIFGEANYYFTPNLHGTFGLRALYATTSLGREGGYWQSEYPAGSPQVTQTPDPVDSRAYTPKFGLTWNIDPTDMVYADIAKGYRLGGGVRAVPVDLCQSGSITLSTYGLNAAPTSYAPDSLWSYEVGSKSRFLNNRLTVDASLFYINWQNIQVDNPYLSCGFDFETNGGKAISDGAEFSIKAKPTRNIVLGFNGGYTNAYYVDAITALSSAAGANIPGVPHYNASVSAEYDFDIGENSGFVRVNSDWTGSSYGAATSTSVDYKRPGYNLMGASAGIQFDKWEVSVFVKNLLNNQKVIQTPDVQTFQENYQLAPRIIGISLSGKI